MRKVDSWETYFMRMAFDVASRSKDPNTQVGAVIVDPAHQHVVVTGYNGFLPGVEETAELWERPTKYPRVVHAETNAIARAARRGVSVDGCTAYVTALPCLPCMKLLIAAGIRKIIADHLLHGWDEEHIEALKRAQEAAIYVKLGGKLATPERNLTEVKT